jgi:uncharacterized protein
MSLENVEVVRSLYQAVEARDYATVAELAHQDLEWTPDRRVGEGPVRGRDNVIRWFIDRAEMFDGLRNEIEDIWENGDRVLVFVRVTGRGEASGAEFDIRIAHLWTVDEGAVVRGEGYGDHREALEAAGLSE